MISVIVPVYDMEQYLERCLQSLVSQTCRDFELILVDDGSKDASAVICDNWVKKDERISVIHKQNGGLSSARNCGIDNAKGQFIIFPDPDDWVEPNYLERLTALQSKFDADLCICERFHANPELDVPGIVTVLDTETALEKLMHPDLFCGFAWNKLYDLNVIKSNDLRFDEELGMAQDLHFNVRYFQCCRKIIYDTTPLYHYDKTTGGVTSGSVSLTQRKMSGLKTYIKIGELAQGKYPRVEEIAYSTLCNLCLEYIVIYYKKKVRSKAIIKEITDTFRTYRKIFYHCDVYPPRNKRFSRLVPIHPYLYYMARRADRYAERLWGIREDKAFHA